MSIAAGFLRSLRRCWGAVPVAAVVLALTPTAPASATLQMPEPTALTVAGQTATIWPAGHRTDRVVLYVHGYGDSATSIYAQPHLDSEWALHDAGYAIASSDADGNAWGDGESVNAYLQLAHYLSRHGYTRIYLLCQSMGGLDGLQLLGRIPVVAWAGIYPLTNLATVSGHYWPSIESVLGSHLTSDLERLSPVRPAYPRGLPMLFWSSYGDTVVPRAQNTDLAARDAGQAGADVTVITTSGDHGDISNFQPQELLSFFDAATPPPE